MSYSDVMLCPQGSNYNFTAALWSTISSTNSSNTQDNDCYLEWLQILNGRFVIVVATPVSEITQSIDENKGEINSSAASLFVTVLIISLICWLVISCLSFVLANQVAHPLRQCCASAAKIASNIGSVSLFDGVDVDPGHQRKKEEGGIPVVDNICDLLGSNTIGEVASLKNTFFWMLVEAVHVRHIAVTVYNPFAALNMHHWAMPGLLAMPPQVLPVPALAAGSSNQVTLTVMFDGQDREVTVADNAQIYALKMKVLEAFGLLDPMAAAELKLFFGGMALAEISSLKQVS